jgi:hypothetical protein
MANTPMTSDSRSAQSQATCQGVGIVFLESKKMADSIADFKQQLDSSPDESLPHHHLGHIIKALGVSIDS